MKHLFVETMFGKTYLRDWVIAAMLTVGAITAITALVTFVFGGAYLLERLGYN